MSVSDLQLIANRENAKRSTGPRTPEGKKRSSLNALRHGLTGQVVVMPGEDLKAYLEFTERYVKDLHPVTEPEKQLAHDIANSQWRLNRSLSIENGIYAIGHHDFANVNDVDHPEIHDALTAATTYLKNGHQLENLSRQENRLRRSLQTSLKLYQDMQHHRREQEWFELLKVEPIYKTHQMQKLPYNPADDGFVISTSQIERKISRNDHYEDAKIAQDCDYDPEKFRARTARQ
jgi:hypothetical protein